LLGVDPERRFFTPPSKAGLGAAERVNIRDKDDLLILSSALNGGADLFITGDKELLGLQSIRNMGIVSPRMFWERLKA
jgi:predicted nucleic acid-binding protein